uniref:BTB domain-containing protein n=1 Tax=Panagrolaimus sp. PS1159 TaxID=55785 RepID=A0AC35F9E8_9BILA
MAQISVLTAVDDTKFYPIFLEYIIDRSQLFEHKSIPQESGNIDGIENTKWTLKMVEYSKGGSAAYEIYFTVKTKMPLKCEVSFEIVSGNKSVFQHFHDSINGSKTFVKSDFLTGHFFDLINEFCSDEKLFLRVKAIFSYSTKEDQCIHGKTSLIQNSDFPKRLQNHSQKDFKFIVGNEFVEIHKSFITRESSVFAAMFEHEDVKETQTGEMIIKDFKMSTVKAFVAFCYGEDIADSVKFTEDAIQLLKFADKYNMKNLMETFEEFYSKKLTKFNVAKVLYAAKKYNAVNLKDKCITFIESLQGIEKLESLMFLMKNFVKYSLLNK